jgi:hypothetical protein
MGLVQLDGTTSVDPGDFTDAFSVIDGAPGLFICTSGTRPGTWGANQSGRLILETDTTLIWRWTGVAWVRNIPKGLLGQNARTTDITTSSTSFVTVISQSIIVPAGGRSVMVMASVPAVQNDQGISNLALFRDSTKLSDWLVPGDTGATAVEQEQHGTQFVLETPSAGTYTYSLQFRAVTGFGGTTGLLASSTAPIQLAVVEV